MCNGTVLIVEDEILIRLMLADVLTEEGYSVVEAGNVLEAVAALGRNPAFDAVITDIDMPGCLNGLDLAHMVRTVAPRTKVVVASGGHGPENCPVDCHFLQKPYSVNLIISLLAEPTFNEVAQAF
ncbi:response regulator [Rhizobium sp. AC44/96]|uniref:response regulator n=1 Tax=unclassified Rhizobium TaxID=2613769 RepID=UPI00080F96D2|nr:MULTISPECIES: response regulator [unclassified Rhizobium]MDM9621998.1 response regulator [Rhizobium sp. S96]OCJ17268.1 response regulator [Rhizobium sp. AC44/96]